MTVISNLHPHLHHEASIRKFLDGLHRNDMAKLTQEIFAQLYWYKRRPEWFDGTRQKELAKLRWVNRLAQKRLKKNQPRQELSRFLSIVERLTFIDGIGRFEQLYLNGENWRCYAYDSYTGLWFNEPLLKLCSFSEGDVTFLSAKNVDLFAQEFLELRDWVDHG